jgi:amino acid transporter
MKEPWYKRDSPIAQLVVIWLLAITTVVAHFTHTQLNFNGDGGRDAPVSWWIVGVWMLTASFATYRYVQFKRRPVEPAELPAEQAAEQETTDAE